MSTPSTPPPTPFATPLRALDSLLSVFEARFAPPAWMVIEAQGRLVLLLNHVLQSEPEAMARLKRQQGKTVLFNWRSFSLLLTATPVGLLDVSTQAGPHDLTLTLTQTALPELAVALQTGATPTMRIEGDVQLAAEVGWLTQHVRWDIEEDLTRLLGPAPAQAIAQAGRTLAQAFKSFTAPPANKAGQA